MGGLIQVRRPSLSVTPTRTPGTTGTTVIAAVASAGPARVQGAKGPGLDGALPLSRPGPDGRPALADTSSSHWAGSLARGQGNVTRIALTKQVAEDLKAIFPFQCRAQAYKSGSYKYKLL